ncbi:MAG: CDP-diacylglycerol--serine O-phosphatidyltransferase [Tidjanibacter sp.]|nr:CDP-diacylglycerol--serine O-phosphatidyltransferase [Tidjanibacter sp.]
MRTKYFTIPNILTLMNLLCGSLAVVTAVSGIWQPEMPNLKVPFIFLIASAVFDFLDGFAARLLGQYSPLGVQLDSLADVVSFGLAPSVILASLFVHSGGVGAWYLITFSVVLCSALRLAKFNIDPSQSTSFEGLPTPASALAVGSLGWLFTDLGAVTVSASWILVISIVLAWLLISPVRMFSLKFHTFSMRDKTNVLRYSFLTVALVILIVGGLGWAWCIIILYIFTSIITDILCPKRKSCDTVANESEK